MSDRARTKGLHWYEIGIRLVAGVAAASALAAMIGCTTGLDSVLFVTKTGLGADLDTKPPTVDIGYSRKEGVLAPVFANGEVLPVLTSIESRTGTFSLVSDQSFATGDAAVVMASAFTSERDLFPTSSFAELGVADPRKPATNEKASDTRPTGSVRTETKESRGVWASIKYWFGGDDKHKRYFFGTDTNVGIQASWNNMSAPLPDALSLGWKRKEFAFVPLIEGDAVSEPEKVESKTPKKEYVDLKLASLLATASGGIDAKAGAEDVGKNSIGVEQMFATGAAATLLAGHPGVRKVLGRKLIKNYDEIIAAEKDATAEQIDLVQKIQKQYSRGDEAKKKSILDMASKLFDRTPALTDPKQIDDFRDAQKPEVTKKLKALAAYSESE